MEFSDTDRMDSKMKKLPFDVIFSNFLSEKSTLWKSLGKVKFEVMFEVIFKIVNL